MFTKLRSIRGAKRRPWSPATAAVSIGAHLLILFGVICLSTQATEAVVTRDEPVIPYYIEVPPEPAMPLAAAQPEVPRVPLSVPTPAAPANPALTPPREIPSGITPEPKGVEPVDPGAPLVAGDPSIPGDPNARSSGDDPGTSAQPGSVAPTEPYTIASVTELPTLRNAREMQRLTERLYPPALRESGVVGTVTLQFVINTDGTVDPASVRVVSATHEGFEAAAIEAAKKLRFAPAKVNGQPVRLLTNIPIRWQVDRE